MFILSAGVTGSAVTVADRLKPDSKWW